MENSTLSKPEFIETAISILDRSGKNPGFSLTVEEQFTLNKYAFYCAQQSAPEAGSVAPRFYSQKETCKIIHCSEPTIIEWRKRGWIKPLHVGSKILYSDEIIQDALKTVAIAKYQRA
jgi:hypothetical protein